MLADTFADMNAVVLYFFFLFLVEGENQGQDFMCD
jgi:hypothetical protein